MSTPPRTRTTTVRYAHMLACIVLVVLGGLADFIHRAQVPHSVCLQHGELLHASPHQDGPHQVGTRHEAGEHANLAGGSESAACRASAPRLDPVAVPDAHEHCLAAATLREAGSGWIAAPPCAAVAWLVPLRHPPRREPVVIARSPLSFAPKHSPPASPDLPQAV